jgi:hypothetical protein
VNGHSGAVHYFTDMKKILSFLLLALALSACDSALASSRCFYVADGATTIVLEENLTPPQITLVTPGEEDLVVTGEMRDGFFVYPDGTELHFDDEKAWFENQTFLEGIEAPSVACEL